MRPGELKSDFVSSYIVISGVRTVFFAVAFLFTLGCLFCGCGTAGAEQGSPESREMSVSAISGEDLDTGVEERSGARSDQAENLEMPTSQMGDKLPVCGVCIASDKAAYQVRLYQIMQKQAEKKGIRLIWKYANWDASLQNEQIRELLDDHVDVLIICPVNSKSMLDSLKEAKSREIPVINLNMKVDAYSAVYVDTYVGASSQEEGSLAAKLASDLLPDGGKAAILEGTPGTDPQIYRTQAFVDELRGRTDIHIEAIRNADWNRQKAERETRRLLKKIPDLGLIYCHDNNMAAGAIAAIQEAGKEQDIQVIGIGEADDKTMKLLHQGYLKGFIVQDPEFEAKSAVNCAVHLAAGGNVRPWIQNPVSIVTEENAADYQRPLEYM